MQPEASDDAPFGPVSWYGVASPLAVSGRAGTMIMQSAFAAGGAAVADGDAAPVEDWHGVDAGDVVWAGAVVGAGADVVGSGAGAVLAVLGSGAGGLVAGATAELPETPTGAGVAGEDGAPLSATAEPSTTAGAAAPPDGAVPAGPAAAGWVQAPAGVLEAVSIVLSCGTLMIAIPAARATASSAAIGAQPRLGFSVKLRA